jgi:hypothetical protein
MLTILSHAALACGGLACAAGPGGPVVQTGEKIAFAIDPEGFVEAHVQVFYEGPPDEFAWVIPVPADPEVFISSEMAFAELDQAIAPRFAITAQTRGNCNPISCRRFETAAFSVEDGGGGALPPRNGVTVTGVGEAGPYDYLVLDGTSGQAVVDFLDGEGFDIVPELADRLAPYIAPGGRFLAVRLQKDADTGDIAPLGFRYPGTEASIPLVLTAIASAPDLGVEVTVFGESRAVPTNYLHVELNEAHFDWQGQGQNYYGIVARAADEAGGQAFVTDFAGPTPDPGALWSPEHEITVDRLAAAAGPEEYGSLLAGRFQPWRDTDVVRALDGFADPSVLETDLARSILPDADLAALHAQLEERLFEPRRRAAALFDQPYTTRMSTTIDPAEMTVDPIFALSTTGLPEVPAQRDAILDIDCRGSRNRRRIVLDDGRAYDAGAFASDEGPAALRIEQLSADEPPVVLVDNSDAATQTADAIDGEGRGCSSGPSGAGVFLGLLMLGAIKRRR